MEEKQVRLVITTDINYTADFLRELANEIENRSDYLDEMETAHGMAEIDWEYE